MSLLESDMKKKNEAKAKRYLLKYCLQQFLFIMIDTQGTGVGQGGIEQG